MSSSQGAASHGRLVRADCAGVMVDFLTGLLVGIRTPGREMLDNNVRGYCGALAALDIPSCVLGDEGGFRGEFFPLIKREFAGLPHFGRHTPSAWRSGGFRDWLVATGKRQVVLGGLSLDNCTLLTALDMLADGYDVHVVVDVSGAESSLVEAAAMARLTQAGAVLHTWVSFACEAMADWQGPYGPAIGKLVMAHSPYGALGVPAAS